MIEQGARSFRIRSMESDQSINRQVSTRQLRTKPDQPDLPAALQPPSHSIPESQAGEGRDTQEPDPVTSQSVDEMADEDADFFVPVRGATSMKWTNSSSRPQSGFGYHKSVSHPPGLIV